MENRFGIKDFLLFLVLAILIGMVGLAMVMFDRQYEEIQAIKKQSGEMTSDMVAIRRQLAQGVVTAGGAGEARGKTEDLEVFKYVVEAQKKPDFVRGDWLIDNFGTKIGRLTPVVSTDVYQTIIEGRVMEGLVTRDPQTLKFVPVLAESWEVSKDGLTMVFKVRKGVTFSDGGALTADDVVFTLNWVMNKDVNAPRARAYLEKLVEVKATGPYEVMFRFSEPYFLNFATVAEASVMPKHFYSRFKPQEFNERTGLLMGTGPYKLADPENWSPGKPIELVRNDRYWGVPPAFERLVFREVEDESASMVMFGNGELDIFGCVPEQYEKLLKDERILKMSQHLKYHNPLSGYGYIGWNQQRKVGGQVVETAFADARVRRAMTLLIDRERMAKEIYLGYATVASGPFDPMSPQSNPEIKPWPYDEVKGKALLAEAGFRDVSGDGVIEGPDGKPFSFKLTYPSGSATYERMVLFVKDGLARAGIKMELEPLDWPVMLDKLKKSEFDACALGWAGVVESDAYQIFHSSQMAGEADNRTHYVNKKLDAVIEEARRTIDDEKRMKLWHEVHRILHEDQPYTFMFNRLALVFLNGRLANVGQTKLGLNYVRISALPIPWYVPKGAQKYTR